MITVTYTDTYGGDLNYSWAKQFTIQDTDTSVRNILKKARQEFGITTKLRKKWDYDSELRYDLAKCNLALHIMWSY